MGEDPRGTVEQFDAVGATSAAETTKTRPRKREETLTADIGEVPWIQEALVAATPFVPSAAGGAGGAADDAPVRQSGLPFRRSTPPQTVLAQPSPMEETLDNELPRGSPMMPRLQYQAPPAEPNPAASPWAHPNPDDAAWRSAPAQPVPAQPVPPPPAPAAGPRAIVAPAPIGTPSAAADLARRAQPTPVAIRPLDPLRGTPNVVGISAVATPRKEPIAPVLPSPSDDMGGETLQLIWFNPKMVPRMRRQKAWRGILEDLEDDVADPEVDDETLDKDAMEIEDNRDTFEILTRARAHTPAQLNEIVLRGRRRGGKFVPPIELFIGTLFFPFDPIEELKATVTIAQTFATADESLAEAIKSATALLELPHLASAPEVIVAPIKRIHDAFRRIERIVPRSYLDDQKRRSLLENRHYQRRDCFGSEHIRALLHTSEESRDGVPTYLPATLAKQLPMFERIRARLIGVVEPAVSQFESHPVSLRAVALGRISVLPLILPPS